MEDEAGSGMSLTRHKVINQPTNQPTNASISHLHHVQVIHDLDSFECTDTVGGHLRFLKPKCDMVITAVRRGQAQVVRPDRQIILKKATANEKAFYEAEECASLESFLLLGWSTIF